MVLRFPRKKWLCQKRGSVEKVPITNIILHNSRKQQVAILWHKKCGKNGCAISMGLMKLAPSRGQQQKSLDDLMYYTQLQKLYPQVHLSPRLQF